MEQKSNAFLEQEKISVLMRKFAVPCIISLLIAALYNIVDQIFIANADYLGSYGNAANNVVFPLTIVALAVAVMIGDGCCAYVSISLGAGDQEKAHKSIGCSVVLCIVSSLVITAVYFVFQEQILAMWYLIHMKAVKLERKSFGIFGGLMKERNLSKKSSIYSAHIVEWLKQDRAIRIVLKK